MPKRNEESRMVSEYVAAASLGPRPPSVGTFLGAPLENLDREALLDVLWFALREHAKGMATLRRQLDFLGGVGSRCAIGGG